MIRPSGRLVLDNEGFFPIECDKEVYLTCRCRKHLFICQDQNSLRKLAFNFPDDWNLSGLSDFSFTVWSSVTSPSEDFVASLSAGGFVVPSYNRVVMGLSKATELSALTPLHRYFEVWAVSNSGNKVLLDKGTYQTRITRKYS